MGRLGKIDGDSLLEDSILRIAVIGKSNYFIDYRNALVDALTLQGINAKAFEEITLDWHPDVVLVIAPDTYKDNLRLLKDKTFLSCAICTEQMHSRDVGYKIRGMSMTLNALNISQYFDIIFDWSISNCKIMSKWHPRVVYFPHSYFDALNITENMAIERKYDLCFIGYAGINQDRRYKILSYLSKRYSVYTKTHDIWNDEKRLALSSSKIYLNLHQDQGLIMESPRLYDYFANRCFVLSEPIKYPDPFIVGKDFDVFIMSNLCKKIDYYLENDAVRNRMIANAYNRIRSVPVEKTIIIIVNAILMELYYYKYNGNLASKARNFAKLLIDWIK